MDVDKVDRRCCNHKVEIGCSIDTVLNNIILILILVLDTNMHNSVLPQFDNLAARMPESKFNIVAETTSLAPDHGDGKFFKFQDKSSSSDSGLFSLSPLNLLNTRAHLPISVQRRWQQRETSRAMIMP